MNTNKIAKYLFSLFFIIAIAVHVYYVIESDGKPLWWHVLYYITYGVCWWAIFTRNKNRLILYCAMALFPFATHFYYAFRHLHPPDVMLAVCILVCVMLVSGFWFIRFDEKSK